MAKVSSCAHDLVTVHFEAIDEGRHDFILPHPFWEHDTYIRHAQDSEETERSMHTFQILPKCLERFVCRGHRGWAYTKNVEQEYRKVRIIIAQRVLNLYASGQSAPITTTYTLNLFSLISRWVMLANAHAA